MKDKLKSSIEKVRGAYSTYKFLEQTPMRAKRVYGAYMIFISICSQLLFYLQAYKIFKNRSAGNLSLPGFLVAIICSLNWLLHSIVIKDRPLFISNVLSSVGISLIIVGILLYS